MGPGERTPGNESAGVMWETFIRRFNGAGRKNSRKCDLPHAGGAGGCLASMGPGERTPGNAVDADGVPAFEELQWGREKELPEIHNPRLPGCGRRDLASMGPGERTPGNWLMALNCRISANCFNGAGRKNSRKSPHCTQRNHVTGTLQWGREKELPEISVLSLVELLADKLQWGREKELPEIKNWRPTTSAPCRFNGAGRKNSRK